MKRLALLPVLLVGACAIGPSRSVVLTSLVGQTETEAVRVLGVPSRTYDTSGHRFLAYSEQRNQVIAGGPFLFGGGFYGARYGYFGAFPTEVIQRQCETTLDVVEGRVQSWSLRGDACG